MNDKGDFYIGNTKISSSSGQQTTFDIPIPTITGEDPNRLSIVADEVIVKERLLVEGGVSKQILSQFDGPVTFNENVRLSNANKSLTVVGQTNLNGEVNVNLTTESSSLGTGAMIVDGGVSIAKNIHIGGNIIGDGASNISGFNNVTATAFFGDGAGLTNTGATLTESTSNITERVVLTDKTSGTMTTAKTDSDLTFNFSTNKLTCGGGFVGNLTGNVTGNADTATLATHVVGTANRVLYNDGNNTTNTSANLTFNGTQLATNNILAQNIRIASSGSNEIDTVSGDLILDSASNNITVSGKLFVSDTTESNSKDTGALIVQNGGLGVEGNIICGKDVIAFNTSDRNLKDNITVIPNALDKINAISGNTFTWKTEGTAYEHFLGEQDTGVIAQEVEALGLPGITTTRDDGTKAVRYDRLIPVLIQAVKELSAKVTALEGS